MEAYVDAKARIFEQPWIRMELLLNENRFHIPRISRQELEAIPMSICSIPTEKWKKGHALSEICSPLKPVERPFHWLPQENCSLRASRTMKTAGRCVLAYIGGVPVEAIRDVLKESLVWNTHMNS